jgi:hypothetical protein
MKLGLQSYVVIIQIDKSYIKFNSNRINSSQIRRTAQNYEYTIIHKALQGMFQHNHHHIHNIRQRKQ